MGPQSRRTRTARAAFAHDVDVDRICTLQESEELDAVGDHTVEDSVHVDAVGVATETRRARVQYRGILTRNAVDVGG